jgi:hypothetical protein
MRHPAALWLFNRDANSAARVVRYTSVRLECRAGTYGDSQDEPQRLRAGNCITSAGKHPSARRRFW